MKSVFLPLALTSLALAAPAVAQPPGPPPGKAGFPQDALEHQKKRADDIALLIGLRPDQRASLDAALGALMPPPPPPRPEGKDAKDGPPPAPPSFEQHLARMKQMAAERTAREDKVIAALSSFYQGLDAQQRTRFEALMRLSPGPGPMMGPPHGPGGPGGPEGPGGPRGPGPRGPGGPEGAGPDHPPRPD